MYVQVWKKIKWGVRKLLQLCSFLCMYSLGGHLYFMLDTILVKGLSKHTLYTYFSGMKIDPKFAFCMRFSLFVPHVLSKCVNMTKNTPFFQFACFCTPKRCTRVHCLVLKNNPNYVNFFTRMISNFKYKCPAPVYSLAQGNYGELHTNQNCACFARYLKIINAGLKNNDISILKQIDSRCLNFGILVRVQFPLQLKFGWFNILAPPVVQARGGALVFEVGYHPRKKIHVIRVVFQDKAMYARTSFRGAKTCKIGKKGVFLAILTSLGKDMADKLRKTHAKIRI